jgi:TRAP-type uncharacterized transport system substrate-binding protein
MITPQPMIYDKLTLYTNNLNKITYQIGNNIQQFYPLDKIIPINSSFEIIKRLENSTNSIGIIEDEAYRQYNNDNPNNSIRQICTIAINLFTLIVDAQTFKRSWDKFTDKSYTFATNFNGSASYLMLNKILKNIINQYDHKIIIIDYDADKIFNAFNNNEIDGYFIITPHPDPIIYNLNKLYPINLIGTLGLDTSMLTMLFPHIDPTFIDASYYHLKMFGSIPTFTSRSHLVASNKMPSEYIMILLRSLFENFTRIKNVGDNTYKQQMWEFNPQYLYPIQISFQLHEGSRRYFEDIGVITYENNKDCVYTIGIDKCKPNIYINPYRLMI